MKYKRLIQAMFLLVTTSSIFAQQPKHKIDTVVVKKTDVASSMMLNASADNGPRVINIGLPAGTGGTTISENGLLVTYDSYGQLPVQAWRQDASFNKFNVLDIAKTAIFYGDIGVSVSTHTNKGTEKLQGSGSFTTNSFGLLRGDFAISGPLKNDFYYMVSAFVNMDPGTYRAEFDRFLDQTQIYKGVINKKYNNKKGEIGLQYKFVDSKFVNVKQSPYIYRSNGKVDELPNVGIGKDSYLERSGKVSLIDPLTGNRETMDIMDDLGSTSHVIDLFGKNKFDNGLNFDYIMRYQYADAGFYNSNYAAISPANNTTGTNLGDERYIYADNNNQQVYTGLVQNNMVLAGKKTKKYTALGRFELSKKHEKHNWLVGLDTRYYYADKVTRANYSVNQEVATNPRSLIRQTWDGTQWVNGWYKRDANGDVALDAVGKPQFQAVPDNLGQWGYNGGMQYYDGSDSKLALYATENWDILPKLNFSLAGRFEWQNINGNWYSEENRKNSPDPKWISGQTQDVKKDFYNTSFAANATYKAFNNFGFTAEADYLQVAGFLSSYAGANDPNLKKSEVTYFSGGIYYNHKLFNVVSKVTQIKRTNILQNGAFNNDAGQNMKMTFGYDVKTIGWTTDVVVNPFKGFNLHLLLTLQDPKYDKFNFNVFGQEYDYKDNVVRSVSKTLIEIDPSYSWKQFKVWLSVRYFSKEYASYPNSVTFAGRWETFAGFNYKHNNNVSFSVNAVNLLNQVGAQGQIAGSNTIIDGSKYYDKPVAGTYIRPFTVEFKTNIRF